MAILSAAGYPQTNYRDRGIYQSYINVVYGLGSALGAALGGAMADRLGWRWVFGIQVPPLVFCWAIALVAVPGDLGLTGKQMTVKEEWRVFDARGSVVLTVAMTSLLLGLLTFVLGSHPVVLTALVILAVSLPTFLYVESRASRPIMPLSLIKSSPRANLIFSNFLAAALGSATLFNIPLFFQAVLLNSATSSGLRLVFFSIISSVVGAATGFLVTSTKRLKWPVVTGALCFLLGTALLCLLQSGWPTWMYVLWLVPSAMGQGFQFAGCFVAVLAASPQHDQAVVTSTLILWRSLGMVIGVASSSLVLQNSLLIYLEKNVKGPQKAEVIRRVRTSIESIATLRGTYRYQVADSYNEAIRATFLCCTVLALVSVLLVVPIKLPRLGSRK
ncbi:major facilitator superfamily transporter [Colletotrichum incanum]|nr:major facilitator superfamily transporter [Colletotrichum incanum]